MGSVGSYEARVFVAYKRDIKVSEPNTPEAIEDFLKSKDGTFGKVLDEEINFDNIDFENEDHIGYVYDYDGNQHHRYKAEGSIEEFVDEDCEYIRPIVAINSDELKHLDLSILNGFAYFDENSDFNENVSLGRVHDYIYCYNDNSSRTIINIPDNILKDLVDKKCDLYLEGNGDGEHC